MKTETTPKAETESRTRIQAYSKSQLAGLYLPHIQSASARRTLRSWIAKNTTLLQGKYHSEKDKAKQGKKKGKPKQSGHFITDHANQIITC